MMRDKAARSQSYVFDIAIFEMSKDFETFDWRWISDRRDRTLTIPETERHAPYSWRAWTVAGHQGLGRIKRRLTKLLTISTDDQRPDPGSADEHVLRAIYDFYSGQNHRFAGGQGGRAHAVGLWRRLSVGLGNPTLIGRRR